MERVVFGRSGRVGWLGAVLLVGSVGACGAAEVIDAGVRTRSDLDARGLRLMRRTIPDAGDLAESRRAFIEQVAAYGDWEALCRGLHDDVAGPVDVVVRKSLVIGEDYFGINEFMKVLADRRVARMSEMLSSLPEEEAGARALALFDENYRRMMDSFRRLTQREKRGVAQVNQGGPHVLNCALYLCSRYCDAREVDERVQAWRRELGGMALRRSVSRGIGYSTDPGSFPNDLFWINMYLSCLQRDGVLTAEELNARVGTRHVSLATVPFRAWDADETMAEAEGVTDVEVLRADRRGYLTFCEGPIVGYTEAQVLGMARGAVVE